MDLLACFAQLCGGGSPLPALPEPQVKQLGPSGFRPVETVISQSQSHQVALNGNRRSLLIGINYIGTQNELHGCIDDIMRMLETIDELGFPREGGNCLVLTDAPNWPRERHPTMVNMRAGIAWLVEGAQPGDALLLHYSGHGGRMPRTDGRDGFHETLCPSDLETAGMLLDNELFETLVRPLPSGCRLTCILDSCHSGGVLDLPYLFTGTSENLAKALSGEAIQMALAKNWMEDWQRWQENDPFALLADVASMGQGLWQLWGQYQASKNAGENGFAADMQGNIGMAVAEVVAITGCASDQTSADVGDVGSQFSLQPISGDLNVGGHVLVGNQTGAGGALTSAFVEAMANPAAKGLSYLELLEHLRKRLAEEGFSQVPQLASTLILDLRKPFSLDTVSLPETSGDRAVSTGYGNYAANSSSGQYTKAYSQGQPYGEQMYGGGDGPLTNMMAMLTAESMADEVLGFDNADDVDDGVAVPDDDDDY